MDNVTLPRPPVQPVTEATIDALRWWLIDRGYRHTKRFPILDHAVAFRTLAGVVSDGTLDREDEAVAYAVLEQCFPEIPYDDPAWLIEPALNGTHAIDAEYWEEGPAIPDDAMPVPPLPRPRRMIEAAISASASFDDDDLGMAVPFLGDKLIHEC